MALVTSRDFQLVPDVLGAVGQGLQTVGQFQQLQGRAQQQDVNQQTQLLTGQVLDQSLPPAQRAAAQQQLTALNPEAAQQLQTTESGRIQGISDRQTAVLKSISEGALQVQSLPDDQSKLDFLNRRKTELTNQGLPTNDTQEVIDLFESGQADAANALIERTIGVGTRLGFIKAPEKVDAEGAKISEVQSSKILPSGLVQFVRKDGTVEVVQPNEADEILVKEAEERGAKLQGLRASEREGGKGAAKIGLKAFDQVGKIRGNVARLKSVVSLVGEGAETGPLAAKLPSFRAETIRLNNLQKELGLDVIGSVTFGALSQGELDLALSTALPTSLEGPALIKWANDKISAQESLARYMEEQAEFLLDGNNVPDWIRHKRTQSQPTNQPGSAQQVGGFTVEVVN